MMARNGKLTIDRLQHAIQNNMCSEISRSTALTRNVEFRPHKHSCTLYIMYSDAPHMDTRVCTHTAGPNRLLEGRAIIAIDHRIIDFHHYAAKQ